MIAIYILPVYLGAHFLVYKWLIRWLCVCLPLFEKKTVQVILALIYAFFVSAMYFGAIVPHGKLEKILKVTGYYWYGITLYTFMVVFSALIFRCILSKTLGKEQAWLSSPTTFLISGALCILMIAGTCIGGHINAGIIRTTDYEVQIDKAAGDLKELNIVLVGDLHLGFNIGADHMQQMVEKINACHPDVVLVAGDFFDNEYDAVQEPERMIEVLQGIESKYGVYAVYGNHDCEEMIIGGFTFSRDEKPMSNPKMDELIEKSNMKLLRDEAILLDDSVYLYGRPDKERPGRGIDVRKTPKELMQTMDDTKPVLVLEHEPKELGELSEAGVDLHLAGHTHDGQTFPLNISCAIIWENSYGLLQKGSMTSIVTSGVGLFGPNLRVGTIPEVCNIHITFQS